VLHDKGDSVLINEPFSLLAGAHQALLTEPVNHPGNVRGSLLDHVHRNVREKIFPAAGVAEMGPNIYLEIMLQA